MHTGSADPAMSARRLRSSSLWGLVGLLSFLVLAQGYRLFVGPLVIGLFAAMIRAFDAHYDALATSTPPPNPPEDGRLSWLETDPAATREDYGGHADPDAED